MLHLSCADPHIMGYNTSNYITYECKQYVSGYVVLVFYTVRV